MVAPRNGDRMAAPGQVIGGRYRLVDSLGAGGMASVWRAEHLAIGRTVALKIIAPELLEHPLALARFRSEARAAASLGSRHVVQLFDYDIDPAVGPYIVMELLEGESLGARLQRTGVLGPRDVIRIMAQVCKGLGRAHAASIIHRDLKPENIFLVPDEDGVEIAKVLDFGVAKMPLAASAGLTSAGLLVGTLSHMSPEQATGGEVDHRSDLYSIGIVAYQCLVGEIPFEQENVGAWLVSICTAPLPVPSERRPDLPAAFDAWFAKACHRDPDQRFQSAQELASSLEHALAARPRLILAEQESVPPAAAEVTGYFVMNSDTTVGPIDTVLLKRGIAAGKVPPTSLVWRKGWTEWKPISDVQAELAEVAIPPEAPPPPGNGLLALGRPSLLPRHAPSTLPVGRIDPRTPRTPDLSEPGEGRSPVDDSPCFYVSDGDTMVGPVSGALLRKGIEAGRVPLSAVVWRDGWTAWRTAGDLLPSLGSGPSAGVALREESGIQSMGAPSILPPSAPPAPRSVRGRSPTISLMPEFYVADGGITVGPVTASVLRRGIEENRVPTTALVWTDGWNAWRPVQEIAADLQHFVSSAPETLRQGPGIEALGSPSSPPLHAPETARPGR